MTCKWLTVFLSDLNYNAQNILFVESEVIGSDNNQNYF